MEINMSQQPKFKTENDESESDATTLPAYQANQIAEPIRERQHSEPPRRGMRARPNTNNVSLTFWSQA